MNYKNIKEIAEIDKIFGELFNKSLCKNLYLLGVASGISTLYKIFNTCKDDTFTNKEVLKILEQAINTTDDDELKNYFHRLKE